MKTKILFTLMVTIFLAGCNKDKYTTKPILKFKSASNDVVPLGGTLRFELEVTDKEGDLSDTFFIKKIRLNKKVVPTIRDSFAIKFPTIPNTKNGIIQIDLTYENYLKSAINPPTSGTPPIAESDTLLFKFAIRDKAKHVSDTVTSNRIVILR